MGDTMTKSELKGALFESERTKTKSELIEELSRRFTSFRERDCVLVPNALDAILRTVLPYPSARATPSSSRRERACVSE